MDKVVQELELEVHLHHHMDMMKIVCKRISLIIGKGGGQIYLRLFMIVVPFIPL
jgi:hypothetical protein